MKRPTIADLAGAAGVSVSTVNRILSGNGHVRPATMQLVQDKAMEIGFYGRGTIESRRKEAVRDYRLGFLLQQSSREVYRYFGEHLEMAARRKDDARIDPVVDFVDDLAPENIAEHLLQLGQTCEAIAVIAGDHPLITQAIAELKRKSVPVVTYITELSAPDRAGHVGLDSWKVGRTAAWFVAKTTCRPGRVIVFIGNHRYRSQDVNDAAFRSFMREHAPEFTVEDSRLTYEEPENAYRMVKELLAEGDDLAGIYVAGGGITGVLAALRETPPEKAGRVSIVAHDLGPQTRKGLTEGLITAALCHPLELISDKLIETMLEAIENKDKGSILQRTVPVEIVTPESV
ncbi:MAG: substrate-binding domain-containing protein [Paracoccaceae bacterium]